VIELGIDMPPELRFMAATWPRETLAEIRSVLDLIGARLESEVASRTPAGATAALRGSIAGSVSATASEGLVLRVGTPLEYGAPVEFGRAPGRMPPVAPLVLWADRKLGLSRDEAESVGFSIALKIARQGTEGARMFRDAFEANEEWARARLAEIPAGVLRRIGV